MEILHRIKESLNKISDFNEITYEKHIKDADYEKVLCFLSALSITKLGAFFEGKIERTSLIIEKNIIILTCHLDHGKSHYNLRIFTNLLLKCDPMLNLEVQQENTKNIGIYDGNNSVNYKETQSNLISIIQLSYDKKREKMTSSPFLDDFKVLFDQDDIDETKDEIKLHLPPGTYNIVWSKK